MLIRASSLLLVYYISWGYVDQARLQLTESRYRHSDIIAAHDSVFSALVNKSIINEVEARQSVNCGRNESDSRALFGRAAYWQVVTLKVGRTAIMMRRR